MAEYEEEGKLYGCSQSVALKCAVKSSQRPTVASFLRPFPTTSGLLGGSLVPVCWVPV